MQPSFVGRTLWGVGVADEQVAEEFAGYVASQFATLYRTACLLTGDQRAADDLVQAALLKALVNWRRIRDADAPDAYVRTIMVNEHRRQFRRRLRLVLVREPRVETIADPTERVDDLDRLRRALAELSGRQRAAVVLRFYEDLSEAEVARILQCSVGTVKSQTSRALAHLRRVMSTTEGRAHDLHR